MTGGIINCSVNGAEAVKGIKLHVAGNGEGTIKGWCEAMVCEQ